MLTRDLIQAVLLSYFLNALKVISFGPFSGPSHFNPRLVAQAKMSLSQAENIFISTNINSQGQLQPKHAYFKSQVCLLLTGIKYHPQCQPISVGDKFMSWIMA